MSAPTKRIGIDARLIYQTGVGVYVRNLLYYLSQQYLENVEFYIYASADDAAKFTTMNKEVAGCTAFHFRECDVKWHGFGEQTVFLSQLMQDHLDLMHFTYFSWPALYPGRFIATVHDITPLLFTTGKLSVRNPLWYQIKYQIFKKVFSRQIMKAERLIVPTRAVEKEVMDYFNIPATKITPIYEGLNYEFPRESVSPTLNYPYLLYVGNFYPHKNVEALIAAFNKVKEKNDFRLLLVGPANYFSRELALGDRVILRTDLGSQDLSDLYKHAYALVFPSFAEGFGLPVVEAMHFGTPLILSDIPVFREIAGDQAVYFDPHSVDSIHDMIQSVIHSVLLNPLKPTHLDESKYSFRTMAEQTLKLYLDMVR
jgi:glycosyltransferase involved in cell wall biosynthesis